MLIQVPRSYEHPLTMLIIFLPGGTELNIKLDASHKVYDYQPPQGVTEDEVEIYSVFLGRNQMPVFGCGPVCIKRAVAKPQAVEPAPAVDVAPVVEAAPTVDAAPAVEPAPAQEISNDTPTSDEPATEADAPATEADAPAATEVPAADASAPTADVAAPAATDLPAADAPAAEPAEPAAAVPAAPVLDVAKRKRSK